MQLCSLFTASICLTALIGDKLVEIFSREELKAVADSSTHGLIGAFSWAATLSCMRSKRYSLTGHRIIDIALCGIIASIIDLDHFFAARSFSLKAATSLDRRPPLHCTSLWLVLLSSAFVTSVVKKHWISYYIRVFVLLACSSSLNPKFSVAFVTINNVIEKYTCLLNHSGYCDRRSCTNFHPGLYPHLTIFLKTAKPTYEKSLIYRQ